MQTMATKKVKSPNEQLWAKEIRRLKQFIRRAEKRGFSYADSIIPEKPAKVTKKSIQHLQSLTPDKLYSRASYLDPQTGVTLTGVEGRKLERSRTAKKAYETRIRNEQEREQTQQDNKRKKKQQQEEIY